LTVRDFTIEMGNLGFELGTTLTLLRRDKVGEVFLNADCAYGQRIGEQEAAAMVFLHEQHQLVVELSRVRVCLQSLKNS
jgi:hypothetical protein